MPSPSGGGFKACVLRLVGLFGLFGYPYPRPPTIQLAPQFSELSIPTNKQGARLAVGGAVMVDERGKFRELIPKPSIRAGKEKKDVLARSNLLRRGSSPGRAVRTATLHHPWFAAGPPPHPVAAFGVYTSPLYSRGTGESGT